MEIASVSVDSNFEKIVSLVGEPSRLGVWVSVTGPGPGGVCIRRGGMEEMVADVEAAEFVLRMMVLVFSAQRE